MGTCRAQGGRAAKFKRSDEMGLLASCGLLRNVPNRILTSNFSVDVHATPHLIKDNKEKYEIGA